MTRVAKKSKQKQRSRGGVPWNVIVATLVMAFAVAGIVIAVAGGLGGGGDGGGAPESSLYLLGANDSRTAIQNGALLDIGGMKAEVFFSEFPPRLDSTMDVYLTDAKGEPVQDARVAARPSMPMQGMTRGFLVAEGVRQDSQPGHYLLSWELPMKAAWNIEVEVDRGGEASAVELLAFLG